MPRMEVTIHDVALAAGVSPAKVYTFFKHPHRLMPTRRRRITEAIQSLGYVHARSDIGDSRYTRIAVVSPYITAYSFVERIKGISSALPDDEYEMLTFSVENEAQLHHYLQSLGMSRSVNGVILMALPLPENLIRVYQDNRMPLVSIERRIPGFPSVSVDNIEGGRLAARYLLNRNYQRPGFMGDSGIPMYAYSAAALRFQGFREELEQAGVGLPESRVAWHEQGVQHVPDAFVQLMKGRDRPDALFCSSDTEAVVSVRTSWEMDIPVPRDLGVLGFDNTELADFTGLSSVDQLLVQSGRDAAEMLMKMIRKPRSRIDSRQYTLKVTERITT